MSRLRDGWQARRGRWWWIAALILVPVPLGSALSVALLLTLVDAANTADQIELIKTGLAIGAGMGGAVALVLAGRRQWSTEQAHRVAEQSAADVRHDATERRITDLYSKAADQLGSDKAAVRLAGLYSLERLAQDTPTLRQTIVNLLCAYLRIPFNAPPWPLDDKPVEENQLRELEVRRTAQHILAAHLRFAGAYGQQHETFWPNIDVALNGAVLYRFDMTGARVRCSSFGGARFVGWTSFEHCDFQGPAIFGGARFEQATSFRGAWFHAEARFRGVHFDGPTRFDDTEFHGETLFGGVRHLETGDKKDGAVFADEATFTDARFVRQPVFEHVRAAVPLVGLSGSVELD
ncbi:pentapeptide repeat-containing protein [Actinophytocola sp.]|uniref:pentapeptide repeat-containing protein n=1 Tax=Actinophytocola sp. TaxID=1872138 RepID=UPI00389986C6